MKYLIVDDNLVFNNKSDVANYLKYSKRHISRLIKSGRIKKYKDNDVIQKGTGVDENVIDRVESDTESVKSSYSNHTQSTDSETYVDPYPGQPERDKVMQFYDLRKDLNDLRRIVIKPFTVTKSLDDDYWRARVLLYLIQDESNGNLNLNDLRYSRITGIMLINNRWHIYSKYRNNNVLLGTIHKMLFSIRRW